MLIHASHLNVPITLQNLSLEILRQPLCHLAKSEQINLQMSHYSCLHLCKACINYVGVPIKNVCLLHHLPIDFQLPVHLNSR